MRGGAQSHLIEASDDHYYVVKFRNNPQHRRILVNELIAAEILEYLQISTPASELVQVSDEFLKQNPEASFQLGRQIIPPEAGWAFGSRFPGDPNVTAIYDFVPDSLLAQVQNRAQFLAVLAFDKWTANADGRQSIFFRAQLKDWFPEGKAGSRKMGFVALMIDHGFIFNGPHWTFPESALQGLYPRRTVYDGATSIDDFQPWLNRIEYFPDEVLDRALRRIPPDWIAGEEEELEKLLETLLRRRKRIGELVDQSHAAFSNWKRR
ncbi:MAG TPA: HipA family kinase [Bryobacteraceae bacterium]|jgi:hypothetical protein